MIERLKHLIDKYQTARANGSLDNTSEATMRTWIDELLGIFGWNVQDTHQVLTEHTLNKAERQKLKTIGSTNVRPDYTLVNGKIPLAFVDAKSLDVNIETSKDAAFQIRSYGWSIGAPFSVVTNFEQLAVYDCSYMPHVDDEASYARRFYARADEYVEKIDVLDTILSRSNVISGNLIFVQPKGNALDENFSKMLGKARIDFAKAIIDNNTIENIGVLSYYVQTIINRILFIRVCESRGLEVDGLLNKFAEGNFWEEFKSSSYGDFYDHYDGPMFKRIPPLQSLQIDNNVFKSFLNNLYYPSPYRFDVIPLKTLSDIYDLFLGYQLVVDGSEVKDELKSEFKKSNGAITTPESIVNQVIECTIPQSDIYNLSIEQIFDLKLIDIACGSGVFLVGAYDYLVKLIEKKLERKQDCDSNLFADLDHPVLNIDGRRKLINNCIYGVDINLEAVEVSKMSLCLRLIDNYSPEDFGTVGLLGSQILKGIGNNIRCGNSLVGTDIEHNFPELSDNIKELQATNAFDWHSAFPDIFENGGFDYVIGNPPYVEVKNYNVGLPTMAAYIKKFYSSSKNGKIDLAIPFIEKGINLLNSNGRLGFIVQKRFFKTEYGKGIRELLTRHKFINGIYDYQETDLFADRITYVAIIVCDKNIANNNTVWYHNSSTNDTLHINATTLSGTPWHFENAQLNAIRLRLTESLGTLKDVCKVKVGVQVLWNDAFQIHVDRIEDGLIHGHSAIDQNVIIEEAACRPLLCNEHFAPLTKRDYSTYALFPYDVTDEGKVTELSITDISERYPRAYNYLMSHRALITSKVQTLPDKNRNYLADEHWHLYTRANNHSAVYEKLVVPMTALYPQASVVMDKHIYCDNANMFFIQIPDATEDKLYALSALINSTIFYSFARSIANPQQGGYYKFNKQFLNPVPIPKEAFKNCTAEIKKLAEIARRIEVLNEQIRISEGKQTSGLENSLKLLWSKLDELCNKLYGITKEEKNILYSTLRFDRNPYGQEH